MSKRHLYTDEVDTFSAESAEEATRMRDELHGVEPGDRFYPDTPFELVPDDHEQHVTFFNGTGRESMKNEYPDWVKGEPVARVEWLKDRIAKVIAPAHIWAKHETGMVCSTEY